MIVSGDFGVFTSGDLFGMEKVRRFFNRSALCGFKSRYCVKDSRDEKGIDSRRARIIFASAAPMPGRVSKS